MTKEIHKALGVSDKVYEELLDKVPKALIESVSQSTTAEIKADAIKKILSSRRDEHSPNVYALIGLMVEQAYNAALSHMNKKPLFKKK